MRAVTAANENIAFRDKCLHLCFCERVIVLPDEEVDTSAGEAGDAKPLSPCIILTLLPYVSKLC